MSQEMRMTMSPIDEPLEEVSPETAVSPKQEEEIPRGETGLRILLTILFAIIGSVVETLVAVIVIFELVATLFTQRAPSDRVRELANRIISYYYRVGRYLTYNESRVPFPFADFPAAVEPPTWSPDEIESKALGIRDFGRSDLMEEEAEEEEDGEQDFDPHR